jgi:hypothetical protein
MKCNRSTAFASIAFLMVCFALSASVSAGPKQSDVFKSIQESVGQEKKLDYTPAILLTLGGVGVMVILMVLSKREQKASKKPVPLNSPAKLTREILREVPLKSGEMKQLKALADSLGQKLGETPDPMTLLLCPSLLARGVNSATSRLDRKLLAQVVRKMKLTEVNQRHEPSKASTDA